MPGAVMIPAPRRGRKTFNSLFEMLAFLDDGTAVIAHTFNSLFEMHYYPPDFELLQHVALSILYLRCPYAEWLKWRAGRFTVFQFSI